MNAKQDDRRTDMTSQTLAIKAENISKVYRIGLKEDAHDSIASAVFDFIRAPVKNYRKYRSLYRFDNIDPDGGAGANSDSADIIWALRKISFEIKAGEIVGVIGNNGAGKSTLLKILSKITDPTYGYAEIYGKVSSLLEVGTGFHPELSGRDNIYLNGTILGMTKKEIDHKYQDIVEFSGVEQFIDTPVKRYSSGMKVRLAFSVAAHLEPDILIIDEVLAVGDLAFQKKCLGKMEGVARAGRTVLFVSHNMGLVSELCSRCLLLEHGEVVADGDSHSIVRQYMANNDEGGEVDLRAWSKNRETKGTMRVQHLSSRDERGRIRSQFSYGEPITFNIGISGRPGDICIVGLSIRDNLGHLILHFSNTDDFCELRMDSPESILQMILSENILNDGTYYVTIWLGDGFDIEHDYVRNCLSFTVESPSQGRIKSKSPVRLPARWMIKSEGEPSEERPDALRCSPEP